MAEQTESIGIAVKPRNVGPDLRRDHVAETHPAALAEVGDDGPFAAVAEWRIAHVVRQTGRRHDVVKALEFLRPWFAGVFFKQESGGIVGQRTSHAAHFKAVGQTVVDEDAAWQWEHLRLVLQASESRRKNQSVVVALELRAGMLAALQLFLAEAQGGQQPVPMHLYCVDCVFCFHRSRIRPVTLKPCKDSAFGRLAKYFTTKSSLRCPYVAFFDFFVSIFVLADVGSPPLNQYSRCQGNDVANVAPILLLSVYVQCASIADSADSVVILNEREKSLHQLKSI